MKMIDLPCSTSVRTMAKKSSTSPGVSTAVGSSRMRISASRYRALMSSTRCCSPTDRSPTTASGSMASPYWRPSSRMRSRAASRSSSGPLRSSLPSITFSATVNTGISLKCWCTMPSPWAMASAELANDTGSPRTKTCPASGW
jgi:hypothetical protein